MAALEDIDGIQSYIQQAKEAERKTNAQIKIISHNERIESTKCWKILCWLQNNCDI